MTAFIQAITVIGTLACIFIGTASTVNYAVNDERPVGYIVPISMLIAALTAWAWTLL